MNEAAPIRAAAPALGPDWLPLLRELGDLKRIRSAGRVGSIAERLFRGGWAALAAGAAPERVMLHIVARALVAARLGDLDLLKLQELGVAPWALLNIRSRALEQVAENWEVSVLELARAGLQIEELAQDGEPRFVAQLADQPRAGVTCPGLPRLLLQPAENHAEHCLAVAVYGVLIAPIEAADPTAVFLAGMAHHLHNAMMPDSGYAGEMLLGAELGAVMGRARRAAMVQLDPALRRTIERALEPIATDRTPEARAFHAADAIDRVLEIEQHLRAARATIPIVLNDYQLVHDGPVKPYHDRILAQVGLL